MANDGEVQILVVVHIVYEMLAIMQSRCLRFNEMDIHMYIPTYIHTNMK